MAPPKYDTSSVVYSGSEGSEQTKGAAQAAGEVIDTRVKGATEPVVIGQAGATLRKTQQQIEAEKLDLELKKKGPPLPTEVDKKLTDLADAYQGFRRLVPKFKGDYVGTVLDTPTDIESGIQDRFPSFGTKGQSEWWKDMRTLEITARNAIFGASLQPNEQKAWDQTTISPGMSEEAVRTNLKRREQIIRERLSRETSAAREAGFRPAQIEAKLGRYAPDFTPEAIKTYYGGLNDEEKALLNQVNNPEAAPPEPESDAQVGGKPITGFRFSDPSQKELLGYLQSDPNPTGEGYARLVTAKAVQEGLIKPEEAGAYYETALPSAQEYLKQFKDPEARKQIPSELNYDEIDKQKRKAAGAGEVLLQSGKNLPASAAQLYEGVVSLPKDAAISALTGEPTGSTKGIIDLATGDKPAWQSLADTMATDYGTKQGFKDKLATDPLGIAGDVSTVLGGAGLAMKAPMLAGRVGSAATTAGRIGSMATKAADWIDPLSGVTNLAKLSAKYGVKAGGATARALEKPVSEAVAFPSNASGRAIREATGSGFERGRAGAPTPRSEAFVGSMRHPEDGGRAAVDIAREAVALIRKRAGDAYTTAMTQFGSNPVPLDIQVVRNRMAAIKPRDYDAWAGATTRPPEHRAWDQMNTAVEEYAAKAAQDPTLLHPMQMDLFKQRLYDVGSKLDGMPDGKAKHIAKAAYDGVKDELIAHDPVYKNIMEQYGPPIEKARELDDTFSLAQQRGKPVKYDTAARKLDTIMRDNYANFGHRTSLAKELFEADPTGTLPARLAGGMVGKWTPRGVNVVGGPAVIGGASGLLSPYAAASLPVLSPRGMGEISHLVGRGAGAVARGVEGIADAGRTVGQGLDYLAHRYPKASAVAGQVASPLPWAQVGSRMEGMEAAQAEPPADEPPVPALDEIDLENLTPEEIEMLRATRRVAGRPGFAYGGAVRRLSHRYNCGGRVRRA